MTAETQSRTDSDGNGAGVTKIRRRGRPRHGQSPVPAAERMRAFRARQKKAKAKPRKAKLPAKPVPATKATAKRIGVTPPLAGERRYDLILAVPPWQLSVATILAMGPEIPAAADSWLALWAAAPMLADALRVMEGWDFHYRSCACWSKDLAGAGHLLRDGHELLLFGTRGTPILPPPGTQPPSVFVGRAREPGAKPDTAYDMLERMFPAARKIELFARQRRAGWDSTLGADNDAGMARSAVEEAEEARRLRRLAADEAAAAERVQAAREAMQQAGLLPGGRR